MGTYKLYCAHLVLTTDSKLIDRSFPASFQRIQSSHPRSKNITRVKIHHLHGVLLLSAIQSSNPLRSCGSEQFDVRLALVKHILAIQHTSLDNLHAREVLAVTVESGSTVTAEVAGDLLSTVGGLGEGLGVASDLETLARDDIVDAVCAAADLLAVGAVAECLCNFSFQLILTNRRVFTLSAGSPL